MAVIHGTCVEIGGAGVLITGQPGSGKSSLALRLIDQPGHGLGNQLLRARLVSDDQVLLHKDSRKGALMATAPDEIKGLLEVRGLGLMPLEPVAKTRVILHVALKPAGEIERLPRFGQVMSAFEGVSVPLLEVDAARPQAGAVVRAALCRISRL